MLKISQEETLTVFKEDKRGRTALDEFTLTVKVKRGRRGSEALKATGCIELVDPEVLASMPQGSGDEVELIFMPLQGPLDDEQVARKYEDRNLYPADPFSLAAAYEDRSLQATAATHWQDDQGMWCGCIFHRAGSGGVYRYVTLSRSDEAGIWLVGGYFAGIRK